MPPTWTTRLIPVVPGLGIVLVKDGNRLDPLYKPPGGKSHSVDRGNWRFTGARELFQETCITVDPEDIQEPIYKEYDSRSDHTLYLSLVGITTHQLQWMGHNHRDPEVPAFFKFAEEWDRSVFLPKYLTFIELTRLIHGPAQ